MVILKTSDDWNKRQKRVVLDPDGWDRTNYQYSWYEELITEEEFKYRCDRSTTTIKECLLDRPTVLTAHKVDFTTGVLQNTTAGVYPIKTTSINKYYEQF